MKTPVSSFLARVKMRWQLAGMNDRVELTDGVLGACRHEKVQPKIAGLAILGLLVGQTILPGAMLISNVEAAEGRIETQKRAEQKAIDDNTPAWAKMLEKRTQQEQRERELRLQETAQEDKASGVRSWITQGKRGGNGDNGFGRPPIRPVPGSKPGDVLPSPDLECEDCDTDVRALDLRRVPTEKELRRAGQLGGALTPTRSAQPEELGLKLDKLMKKAGIEGGLRAQLPKKDPRERGLQRAKAKYARAQAINLNFGRAIQEWNKHNYRQAAGMFEKHLKDYPESPWAGEAQLHLGCDAKYNGRFAEAQTIYNALLEKSSDKPNPTLKQKKKERRNRGGAPSETEMNEEVERAAKSDSLEAAVDKLDMATENDDESFDIHMKALARWADLDIAVGRWDDSAKKLQHVVATDTDWRRVTWAQSWLVSLSSLGSQAKLLAACGPKALERIFNTLGKPGAARLVGAVEPKTMAGLSLAELETLSAKNGLGMHAFKISNPKDAGAALENMKLPAIVHYDGERGFDQSKSYYATRELKRAPLVAMHPDMKAKGQLPAKVAQQIKADKGGVAADLFKSGLGFSGHYLVLEKVDAKTRKVSVFDPQENRFYQLSYSELGEQWSGKGLSFDSPTRLAKLSKVEKEETFGGCCGNFTPPTEPGCSLELSGDEGGCGSKDSEAGGGFMDIGSSGSYVRSKGSPVWSVNRTNLNVFVRDTPLWVNSAKGPDVEITLSYNSHDAITQHNAFGNKWMFNYGSYVTEDTQYGGGEVLVFMPDGSQDAYNPNGNGGYTSLANNQNTLVKLNATRYELRFPGGDKAIYDIPQGTTSLQPFIVALVDRHGFGLSFGYDANVHLTSITDAVGQVTRLVYDNAGHVTRVFDPWGRHASFSYDANGNLVECIDMEGHAFQYTYDNGAYLTRLNTAQGPWTFTHYYGYPHRQITVQDPNGKSEYWTGSWWGPSYSYVDKKGATTSSYGTLIDGYQIRMSQESFPDGTSTSKQIDTNTGLPTSITGRDGKTSYISYNSQQQPTQITDPKGQPTTFTYHANGIDVASIVNAQNQTTATYYYDNKHQPTQFTDAIGTVITMSYTAWGAPQSVSANGHLTQMAYNAIGQVTATTRDGVLLGSTTYDEKGRAATQTDQLGMTVAYEYNNLDHVTKEKYPDGTNVTYDYTCCGLPGIITDRAGRKSYFDYDPMKRLARVQDAKGDTLQMDYDAEGKLVRLLDGKGSITKWQYNGIGALLKKIYADGSEQNYTYVGGRLSTTTDARNRTTQFAYDNNGNLTGINYPNDADVSITYNSLDKPLTMTDGLGTTTLGYDNARRLTSVDGPWSNDTVNYTYDAEGRRSVLSMQKPDGTIDQTGYVYDALGRLDMITSNAGTFNYNYQGNTSRITQLLMPNGTKTNYSYTALGELDVLHNVGVGNANISRYDYNYDARGVRTALQEQIEADPVKTLQFSYDPTNQLASEAVTGGKAGEAYTANYEYDAAGNRTRYEKTDAQGSVLTRLSNNKLNQTTATRTTAYGVGSTSGLSYDAAGNIAQINSASGSNDYVFDDANRLKAQITRDAAGVAQSKTEFVYDIVSRLRISKQFVWANDAWQPQTEKRRIYDGFSVLQERSGSGNLTGIYTHGPDIGGELGSLLSHTFDTGISFMHYDGRGNVVQLTDASGAVSGKYTYDAFGNTLSLTGGAAGLNSFRFSTKEYVGGLIYYGFRFYAPSLGKWINRDPISEKGGINLYGFVENSPIDNFDSYGLASHCFNKCMNIRAGKPKGGKAAACVALCQVWHRYGCEALFRICETMGSKGAKEAAQHCAAFHVVICGSDPGGMGPGVLSCPVPFGLSEVSLIQKARESRKSNCTDPDRATPSDTIAIEGGRSLAIL